MGIIYLIIAFILNGTATVLFKVEAGKGIILKGSLLHIISSNYAMILGFILFAINAIFYILALRSLPLALAYPVMTVMSLIIVTAASIIIFHEHITPVQIVGYLLLIVAIVLIFNFKV
ncbi:MAG: putative Conserved rane protein [Candidatus Nomurabacteria bacterium]|jgi:multidrug transporter EmrE-like cation transporter|nr:putative Conserved rane protein [Candidatus Nomurabacteria bacterium]